MSVIQNIFAYNTGSLISGTTQVGFIAVKEADVVVITFGGTGFCGPNSKILKNGVDTGYPLAGYAGNPFTLGGLAFASGDQITIIID